MQKVKVSVKGAGSLEVEGVDPKTFYKGIISYCQAGGATSFREIKRGPRKKAVVADEGSEAVPAE